MPSAPAERPRPRSAREYQTLARNRLIESRLTPNAISLTGLALCVVAAAACAQGLFARARPEVWAWDVPPRSGPEPVLP